MHTRHQQILQELERRGACTYLELVELLQVSAMTVRRDVEALARAGLALKVLCGVQRAGSPSLYESTVQARLNAQRAEKQAIAELALTRIGSGQTLFLDGSTTCWVLARLLTMQTQGLTIVTHSAPIALECGQNRRNIVLGLGGEYDADSQCFVGPASEDAAASYFPDLAFFSTKGLLPDEGTFESSPANFRIKGIIARQARQTVLLVDHTKFGQRGLRRVLDIRDIDTIITDAGTSTVDLATLQRVGRSVLVAPLPREESHAA